MITLLGRRWREGVWGCGGRGWLLRFALFCGLCNVCIVFITIPVGVIGRLCSVISRVKMPNGASITFGVLCILIGRYYYT